MEFLQTVNPYKLNLTLFVCEAIGRKCAQHKAPTQVEVIPSPYPVICNGRRLVASPAVRENTLMRFFLAGIMQGSHLGAALHTQDYRAHLRGLIEKHFPAADVYDPLHDHQNSLDYDPSRGREVFLDHNRLCREVDVVLAFLPEASMGTAIEIWEAHRYHRVVITISPLAHNWAVQFLSDVVFADLESFESALAEGDLAKRIDEIRTSKSNSHPPL